MDLRLCEHCQEDAPAEGFRVWTFHDHRPVKHAPRTRMRVVEMELCPDCYAAAVADEARRLGPSRIATAVLGGVFLVVLVVSIAFPQLWPTVAGWFAKPTPLQAAGQRAMPTVAEPWAPRQVIPPTGFSPAPTPAPVSH